VINQPTSRLPLLATSLLLGVPLLAGCGLFGDSWDVRIEVAGPGPASVGTKFAGDPDPVTVPATLPISVSRNVGFGFNVVAIEDAEPGTVCRVFVDDVLRAEKTVDASGRATCQANNQDGR
jgi:hypothetical protein